ncbi:DUF1176 domain-containing protein [Aurantimonas sp. Leaf443]|uniref:DUF1176 domain-containing protein n=1 Tax=Aurantimonas sp. Leaf443 TaxID=1736378 RepID=UPI0006F8FE2F|nr:DUF1176 domain-containing protein [Aurantimonas sp. Leaf443]KQT86026.1 hypothetical protein ASG48_05420 [Aurantimonas sp. Leaf443]
MGSSLRIALSTALAIGTVAPARAGPSATFMDWTVVCSDGLACSASVFREGAEGGLRSLAIRRAAGGDAAAAVTLGADGRAAPTGPVVFTPDDGAAVSFSAEDFGVDAQGNLTARPGEVGARLQAALRRGTQVRIAYETAEGPREGTLSTRGFVAALRFMDEAQYRAGTVSALEAKGPDPARAAALLPKDIATAADLPEVVRRLWADGAADCAAFDGYEPDAIGFSAPLGTDRLFGLLCGSPGAYNSISRFYRLSQDGSAEPVALPGMSEKGPVALDWVMNADWDDRSRTLTAFARGRGLGDCGTFDRWHLETGELGFVLVESRAKDECDGDVGDGPESWERLWPR